MLGLSYSVRLITTKKKSLPNLSYIGYFWSSQLWNMVNAWCKKIKHSKSEYEFRRHSEITLNYIRWAPGSLYGYYSAFATYRYPISNVQQKACWFKPFLWYQINLMAFLLDWSRRHLCLVQNTCIFPAAKNIQL